jgi:hypothetical protein
VLGIVRRCQSDFPSSETSKPGSAGLGGIVLKQPGSTDAVGTYAVRTIGSQAVGTYMISAI